MQYYGRYYCETMISKYYLDNIGRVEAIEVDTVIYNQMPRPTPVIRHCEHFRFCRRLPKLVDILELDNFCRGNVSFFS